MLARVQNQNQNQDIAVVVVVGPDQDPDPDRGLTNREKTNERKDIHSADAIVVKIVVQYVTVEVEILVIAAEIVHLEAEAEVETGVVENEVVESVCLHHEMTVEMTDDATMIDQKNWSIIEK